MDTQINSLISQVAARFGLASELVAAFVQTESGGNAWASRFEPAFLDKYIGSKVATFGAVSLETERMSRATSYGLMQVMGQVARERGFTGSFLTQLCDPETGLSYGCMHLASMRDRYLNAWGWDGVIAAFNAGSPRKTGKVFVNQGYVDKINKAWKGATHG